MLKEKKSRREAIKLGVYVLGSAFFGGLLGHSSRSGEVEHLNSELQNAFTAANEVPK